MKPINTYCPFCVFCQFIEDLLLQHIHDQASDRTHQIQSKCITVEIWYAPVIIITILTGLIYTYKKVKTTYLLISFYFDPIPTATLRRINICIQNHWRTSIFHAYNSMMDFLSIYKVRFVTIEIIIYIFSETFHS